MKAVMNETLQSIIIAVQDYRKWRYSNAFARNDEALRDRAEEDSYLYFKRLDPARAGIDTTRKCYEAVVCYPIKETLDTDMELLGRFAFGW